MIFESPKKEGCSIHRKSTDDASHIDHFSDFMTDHQESKILQQTFDAKATATLAKPYSFVGMTIRPQVDLLRGNIRECTVPYPFSLIHANSTFQKMEFQLSDFPERRGKDAWTKL